MIKIQVQFSVGEWRTVQTNVLNSSQRILRAMESAQQQYRGKRVRAVDGDNRIVDLLN